MNKLSSLPEKHESFEQHAIVEHWMFVSELIELLNQLNPEDWITPNNVHNLSISREGQGYIGYIDFANNTVDIMEVHDEQE